MLAKKKINLNATMRRKLAHCSACMEEQGTLVHC